MARDEAAAAPMGDVSDLSPQALREVLLNLRLHQIELETQNENLRRIQAELDAAQARYFDFYDLAPVGYVTVSEKALILQANLTTATLLGITRSELIGKPLPGFMSAPDADRFYLLCQQALASGSAQSCELQIRQANGDLVWISLQAIAAKGNAGEAVIRIVLSDITERKRTEVDLESSLNDKDALLKEVHHRVKNNLQVITSLLRLESRRSTVDDTKTVLGDMQARIRAMALLHESLYRSGTFASVDLGSYLKQLSQQAFQTQSFNADAVQLELNLDSVQVGMDQAIPCGLLINELISNCLKHGFPAGVTGHVSIDLQPLEGAHQWRLRVCDTGVGLPEDFEDKRKTSLGLQLAGDLARQIGGELKITPNQDKGVAFTVNFRAIEPAPLVIPV